MHFNIKFLAVFIVLFLSFNAIAFDAEKTLSKEQERRAEKIFYKIRCVVCEGQALAESEAQLAKDIRNVIRNEIKKGYSDKEIYEFLSNKYGEDILLKPPFNIGTSLLWLAPVIFILFGGFIIFRNFRRS